MTGKFDAPFEEIIRIGKVNQNQNTFCAFPYFFHHGNRWAKATRKGNNDIRFMIIDKRLDEFVFQPIDTASSYEKSVLFFP